MLPSTLIYVVLCICSRDYLEGYCFMGKRLTGKVSDVTFAISYERIFVIGQVDREIQCHELKTSP